METNPSKCRFLHITRSRYPITYSYTMHGHTLELVENARYLGVNIILDLSFPIISTSNAQKIGVLKRNINYLFWHM